MNKRITSILLCFVMLFSMLVSAVPSYAAPVNPPMIYIEADRTEASPGDTITYKFYLQQPDTMTAFAFNMVAPNGLTYVEGSGKLGSTASAAWGSTFEWVPEADLQLQWYSSSGDDVTDTSKIELITIQFKVAADATIGAEYEMDLKNMQLAAGSTQNYDDISSTVEVSTAKVKIVAKPVAVTGVTIDETLSVKTGESKTPSYTVNPAEATNKAVSFKSDNTAVATVNETTGEVTGVKEGTATITITTADGITIIPVSKVSVGFAGGGSDYVSKNQNKQENPFAGGAGGGVKVTPVAFLVIKEGNVRMIPVAAPANTTVDRLVEMVPDTLDKLVNFLDSRLEKKAE